MQNDRVVLVTYYGNYLNFMQQVPCQRCHILRVQLLTFSKHKLTINKNMHTALKKGMSE